MGALEEKFALVTGAARGIGKSIALELAHQGCSVVVCDIDESGMQKVAEEIKALGVQSKAFKADISVESEVEDLIARSMQAFRHIDILVNNAGVTRDNLLMRMSVEEWDLVLRVNLRGAFLCTKGVIREMIKQRSGKIINIASVFGVMGNAGQANYVASKAGLIGLTKSIAKEVASRNIQVNAIAPGFIETEMTADLPQEIKDSYLNNIPAKRAGRPEDVAKVASFLASPDSNYITGQVILVDGGLVMA